MYHFNKKIDSVRHFDRPISAVYHMGKIVWMDSLSSMGRGYWDNADPWFNQEMWNNGNS